MKFGTKVLSEKDLSQRHVKDNKTRFYWINVPEVGEQGAGLLLNFGKTAVIAFLLWKHL